MTGIVGAVSNTESDDVRVDRPRNLDAFEHMLNRPLAYRLVDMAQAAKPVKIVLKEIRIDCTNPQAERSGILFYRLPIVLLVSVNVNGVTGADTGDLLEL